MALTGVNTAFFWPVMMGWVSTGSEGAELSKRFGFYNTTWGIATMITPIIAGYLVEVNYTLPILAAVIASILCFVLIASSKYSYKTPSIQLCPTEQIDSNKVEYNKTALVWIARIALFVTFTCVGIFSSQVCILYKFELGFTESIYGWSIAIMYFFNVTVFYTVGKSHWWHYKKAPFAVGTVAILLSMLIILLSKSVAMQFLAAAITGICYAFAYSSHQYYGVSGGKKRSGLMAIHEIIIGIGVSIGALFGGILSDTFGRYTPYKFACILISVAAIVQIILWFSLRKKTVLKTKNLNGTF
jgi:MFS family permease